MGLASPRGERAPSFDGRFVVIFCAMKRSGVTLALAGLVGMGLFWLTDPRYSPFASCNTDAILDAARQSAPGTVVGFAGCAIALCMGLYLMARRRP